MWIKKKERASIGFKRMKAFYIVVFAACIRMGKSKKKNLKKH